MDNDNKKKILDYINFTIEKFLPCILPLFLFFLFTISHLFLINVEFVNVFLNKLYAFLGDIFNNTRMGIIINISVVLIGLYVTIMSVFGSSYSISVIKMSEKNLGTRFVYYASEAIISSFIHFILAIFFNNQMVYIYSIVFIWTLANFLRFSIVVLYMYHYNIKCASELTELDKKDKARILELLISIESKLSNNNEEDIRYFNEIKAKMDGKKSK